MGILDMYLDRNQIIKVLAKTTTTTSTAAAAATMVKMGGLTRGAL